MHNTRKQFVAVILAFILFCPRVNAEVDHELLVFLSVEGANKLLEANDDIKSPDGILAADVLYSFSWDRFRFLGEYLASNKETELERLHVGAEIGEENFVWIGRFHAPSNFWMTSYHHGQYLQTSISKPGIAEFEDFAGIIPSHTTGLLLDGTHVFDDSTGIKAAFSIGSAPVLEDGFLEAFDILNPTSNHNLAYHFRFSYQPDFFNNNKVGIVATFADINTEKVFSDNHRVNAIEQVTVGAFVDWYWQEWRFLSSVSHIINRIDSDNGVDNDSFTLSFVQSEFELNQDWTFFARVEESFSKKGSPYLQLIPNFVESRQMLGARFDFIKQHAMKLEISNIETVKENFVQVRLQWSAVFP